MPVRRSRRPWPTGQSRSTQAQAGHRAVGEERHPTRAAGSIDHRKKHKVGNFGKGDVRRWQLGRRRGRRRRRRGGRGGGRRFPHLLVPPVHEAREAVPLHLLALSIVTAGGFSSSAGCKDGKTSEQAEAPTMECKGRSRANAAGGAQRMCQRRSWKHGSPRRPRPSITQPLHESALLPRTPCERTSGGALPKGGGITHCQWRAAAPSVPIQCPASPEGPPEWATGMLLLRRSSTKSQMKDSDRGGSHHVPPCTQSDAPRLGGCPSPRGRR